VTRPVSPKAVVWNSPGRDVMHHRRISTSSQSTKLSKNESLPHTLRLELL